MQGESSGGSIDVSAFRNRFIEAMDDDFNTAQAVATLFDLTRDINRADESGYNVEEARELLKELAGMLGLTLADKSFVDISGSINILPNEAEKWQLSLGESISTGDLISVRNKFREAKQWQLADEIRAKLDEAGIALEDTPQGTVWKRKR